MDRTPTPTLAQILKAAAVLADADTDTLALRTGILRSRLTRLLNGSAAPSADEAERILKAAGCKRSLLTEHIEASGSHGVLAALIGPDRLSQADACISRGSCYLTIDKLSIVFNPVDGQRLIETAQRYGARVDAKLYKLAFAGHGVRVDHSPAEANNQIRRSSRIEFNPEAALSKKAARNREAGQFASAVMRLLDPTEAEITRVDVAVDLPVALRDVQALSDRTRKFNLWLGAEGIETVYCGSRGSERQIVLYDKRREQRDRGKAPDLSSPLTRIEAHVQRPGLGLLALPALENPFTRLRLFLLRPDGLPFERRLLVEYARFFGLPALKGELDPDDFEALCSDLELSDAAPLVPHPRDVFTARWPAVSRSLLSALRLGARP